MRKHKFFTACAILAGVGGILSAAGIAAGGVVYGVALNTDGFSINAPQLLKNSGKGDFQEKEEVLGAFECIEASLETADLRLETSDTDEYRISYCLDANTSIQYETVEDGRILRMKQELAGTGHGKPPFHGLSFFSFGVEQGPTGGGSREEAVTVYVPKHAKLAAINIKSSDGEISCKNIQSEQLELKADYGDVNLNGVAIGNLAATMENGNLKLRQASGASFNLQNQYGDITADGLKLTGGLRINAETGDIWFQNADCADASFTDSDGSITLQQSSIKTVQMDLESGSCSLSGVAFQKCILKAQYGDVQVHLAQNASDYGYKLTSEYGSIQIDGQTIGNPYTSLDKGHEKTIEAECEAGDIEIQSR